jgi:putative transposase
MPNHFHLFIQQITRDGISVFMKSLSASYVMYFNKRHERSGTLFQGVYRAALIESEPYFLHLSRYIHLNPVKLTGDFAKYPYSSYQIYLGEKESSWVDPGPVLDYFRMKKREKANSLSKHFSYQAFVEDSAVDSVEVLQDAAIENP